MQTRRLDQLPPNDVIPYRPGQKATIALTLFPLHELALTVVGRYVGSQSFQNPDTSRWGKLGDYEMVDARLDVMAMTGVRCWIRGTNLMDANVQGQFSFPEPGRQVFLGVSSTWPAPDDEPRGAT